LLLVKAAMSQDSPLRQSGDSVRQALTAYRDLVRRESDATRGEDSSELATAELSSLVYRVSGKSTREIDHLIDGLKDLRKKLDNDGNRVHREIAEYASLSQSVIQLTKIIAEGMTQVQKVSDAPNIRREALSSSDGLEERI
jgi:hypothetical protein